MSTVYAAPLRRHALGLPAGSVRAAHVLGIVGLICAIILMPAHREATIPPYLIYLLFLMLGHFFAAHGVTIAMRDESAPSPLYLPGGTVRTLVLVALAGTIGWKMYSAEDDFYRQFTNSLEALKDQPYLPLAILGGFLLGIVLRCLVGRNNPAPAMQDIEAWISLIALIGLVIAALIHLVIEPSLEMKLMIPTWDACLGGVIAFYFGERS